MRFAITSRASTKVPSYRPSEGIGYDKLYPAVVTSDGGAHNLIHENAQGDNMSKNLYKTLAALTLALALPAGQAMAQGKELIVATDTAFVPFEFKQDGKYTSFDIDLWEAIAKQAGLSYQLRPMDFNGIIPGLQSRNLDVALAG